MSLEEQRDQLLAEAERLNARIVAERRLKAMYTPINKLSPVELTEASEDLAHWADVGFARAREQLQDHWTSVKWDNDHAFGVIACITAVKGEVFDFFQVQSPAFKRTRSDIISIVRDAIVEDGGWPDHRVHIRGTK